ncbi:MAG TPA: hypothetical protein DIT55_05245 [Spirochaetaceae bacterium]|nr:hypothetical protein [Spirochaetaceae bacterium]
MSERRWILSAALGLFILSMPFAQGADPKTVKPAWEMEKQFEKEQEEGKAAAEAAAAANIANAFNVFFIGYDVPTLSGPLADDLAAFEGPVNFSLGIETSATQGSSFLSGAEGEFSITVNDIGMRLLMNSMALFGYSFELTPMRLNLGIRAGLSVLDVTTDGNSTNTYMALGLVFGPETALYLALDPSSWIWVRGRYSMAAYTSLDSDASPIGTGNDSLDCLSLEAGLAFKI